MGVKTEVQRSVLGFVTEIENKMGSVIEEFIVSGEIKSDHLPVQVYLEGKYNRRNNKKGEKGVKQYRLKWEKSKESEYEREKMEGRREEIGKVKDKIDVQESWNRLIKNIEELEREMKMMKEIKEGGGEIGMRISGCKKGTHGRPSENGLGQKRRIIMKN